MPVLSAPGVRVDGSSSDTWIGEPADRSCPHRHSVIVVTAAFVVAYTALLESGANVPFDDDVFITWPGSPCSSSTGTNVLMPLITPNTLTSTAQRQSFTWCCHSAPSEPDGIPALLHTRCTAPNCSRVASRRCSTDSSSDTSVGHADHVAAAGRQLAHRGVEQRFVDVGQHDLHALGQEPLAQRTPDATATAGDHGVLPPRSCIAVP